MEDLFFHKKNDSIDEGQLNSFDDSFAFSTTSSEVATSERNPKTERSAGRSPKKIIQSTISPRGIKRPSDTRVTKRDGRVPKKRPSPRNLFGQSSESEGWSEGWSECSSVGGAQSGEKQKTVPQDKKSDSDLTEFTETDDQTFSHFQTTDEQLTHIPKKQKEQKWKRKKKREVLASITELRTHNTSLQSKKVEILARLKEKRDKFLDANADHPDLLEWAQVVKEREQLWRKASECRFKKRPKREVVIVSADSLQHPFGFLRVSEDGIFEVSLMFKDEPQYYFHTRKGPNKVAKQPVSILGFKSCFTKQYLSRPSEVPAGKMIPSDRFLSSAGVLVDDPYWKLYQKNFLNPLPFYLNKRKRMCFGETTDPAKFILHDRATFLELLATATLFEDFDTTLRTTKKLSKKTKRHFRRSLVLSDNWEEGTQSPRNPKKKEKVLSKRPHLSGHIKGFSETDLTPRLSRSKTPRKLAGSKKENGYGCGGARGSSRGGGGGGGSVVVESHSRCEIQDFYSEDPDDFFRLRGLSVSTPHVDLADSYKRIRAETLVGSLANQNAKGKFTLSGLKEGGETIVIEAKQNVGGEGKQKEDNDLVTIRSGGACGFMSFMGEPPSSSSPSLSPLPPSSRSPGRNKEVERGKGFSKLFSKKKTPREK